MAINRGYLKVPRALFATDSWHAKRTFSRFEAMLWLLEQAAYIDGRRVAIGHSTFALQRGQVVATVRSLAEAWGWSKDAVSRFLAMLANSDMSYTQLQITVENIDSNGATVRATAGATLAATAATRITICDYDAYALASAPDATACATASATAGATALYKYENKEEKNSREIKEEKGNECSRACVGEAAHAPTTIATEQPQERAQEKVEKGRTDPAVPAIKNNLDYNSANSRPTATPKAVMPATAKSATEKSATAKPMTAKSAAAAPQAVAPAATFAPTAKTSAVPMPVIDEPRTLPEKLVCWAQYNYPQLAGMRYPLTVEDAEYMLKLYTPADIRYLFGRMHSKEAWLNNTYFLSTFLAYARHDKSVAEIRPPKPKISPNPKHRC